MVDMGTEAIAIFSANLKFIFSLKGSLRSELFKIVSLAVWLKKKFCDEISIACSFINCKNQYNFTYKDTKNVFVKIQAFSLPAIFFNFIILIELN